jgi:serine/threonine protein kinase
MLPTTSTAASNVTSSSSGGNSKNSSVIDPDFEYKGYHKFGRILGKGSFGTVIECVRKCDQQPIALKLFKFNAIHKWIPESMVADNIKPELREKSEFFGMTLPENVSNAETTPSLSSDELEEFQDDQESEEDERMLPSEVACLIRASSIDGVVKILDYIPESSVEHDLCDNSDESIIGIVLERDPAEICFFDYLIQSKYLDEAEARVVMRQLVEICINLLHAGILHGDLKSENILINPATLRIKVIDFGSAQLVDANNSNSRVSSHHSTSGHHSDHHHHNPQQPHHSPPQQQQQHGSPAPAPGSGGQYHHNSHIYHHHHHHHHFASHHAKCKSQSQSIAKPFRTFRGTNLYKPPEYILHHCFYPRASTVWSFGIIMYDMVCGNFPFDKDSDILTHQDKEIEFSRANLSDSFEDLVRKCLSFYVCDRINIEKILNHPWLDLEHSVN